MSIEENKQVVKRLIEEGFNQGRDGLIDQLVSSRFRSHGEEMTAEGPEAMREMMVGFHTAFPDAKLTIEHILAEGDRVMTWATFTGTHRGPLEALPPTGKKVQVTDVDLWRLENGQVVELWADFDQPGMLQQLGVLSMPEES